MNLEQIRKKISLKDQKSFQLSKIIKKMKKNLEMSYNMIKNTVFIQLNEKFNTDLEICSLVLNLFQTSKYNITVDKKRIS